MKILLITTVTVITIIILWYYLHTNKTETFALGNAKTVPSGSTLTETFALGSTVTIPSGTTLTVPGLAVGSASLTGAFTSPDPVPITDFSVTSTTPLDPNAYYYLGQLNTSSSSTSITAKNGGSACPAFPSMIALKLPKTDATCKTALTDLYTYPADSYANCTFNTTDNKYYKTGTLNTDTSITLSSAFNGGNTCTSKLTAAGQSTNVTTCQNLDAVCKFSPGQTYTDADVFDISTDSNTTCSIEFPAGSGKWFKFASLKSEANLAIKPAIGTGRTCTQQALSSSNPLGASQNLWVNGVQQTQGGKLIQCGAINAVCNDNFNTNYTTTPNIYTGEYIYTHTKSYVNNVIANYNAQQSALTTAANNVATSGTTTSKCSTVTAVSTPTSTGLTISQVTACQEYNIAYNALYGATSSYSRNGVSLNQQYINVTATGYPIIG